jgi:hypothetical protein
MYMLWEPGRTFLGFVTPSYFLRTSCGRRAVPSRHLLFSAHTFGSFFPAPVPKPLVNTLVCLFFKISAIFSERTHK